MEPARMSSQSDTVFVDQWEDQTRRAGLQRDQAIRFFTAERLLGAARGKIKLVMECGGVDAHGLSRSTGANFIGLKDDGFNAPLGKMKRC
jgi:hypothetical protein